MMNLHRQQQCFSGMASRQRGVVLLVSLILLLLTTFIGYSIMETSSLEARMAAMKEGQLISFQAAESIIEQVLETDTMVLDARTAHLAGATPPTGTYSFTHDPDITGSSSMRYVQSAAAYGEDWETGFKNQYFELDSRAERTGNRFQSHHVQGVRVLAPSL